jgi:hypothetical protein
MSEREDKTNWPQRIEAVCAVLLVVITGAYTYYAAGQLHKMKRAVEAAEGANKISREALVVVQGAFVTFRDLTYERLQAPDTGKHYWNFDAVFENSGTTQGMKAISYFHSAPLANDLSEEDFVGSQAKFIPTSIGPKATPTVGPVRFDESDIFGIELGSVPRKVTSQTHLNRRLTFWGWLRYRDRFANTETHIAEYCQRLEGAKLENDGLTFRFVACETHNCNDDDCADYKDLLAKTANK